MTTLTTPTCFICNGGNRVEEPLGRKCDCKTEKVIKTEFELLIDTIMNLTCLPLEIAKIIYLISHKELYVIDFSPELYRDDLYEEDVSNMIYFTRAGGKKEIYSKLCNFLNSRLNDGWTCKASEIPCRYTIPINEIKGFVFQIKKVKMKHFPIFIECVERNMGDMGNYYSYYLKYKDPNPSGKNYSNVSYMKFNNQFEIEKSLFFIE